MRRLGIALIMSVALAGCVQTRQFADVEFEPPQGDYKLLVMRPDVSVGSVTTGGMVEPRADWTEQARTGLLAALKAVEAADVPELGYEVVINSDEEVGSGGSAALIAEAARGKRAALTYEPSALPDGTVSPKVSVACSFSRSNRALPCKILPSPRCRETA